MFIAYITNTSEKFFVHKMNNNTIVIFVYRGTEDQIFYISNY